MGPNPTTGVLIKRENRDTEREQTYSGEGHMEVEAETEVLPL